MKTMNKKEVIIKAFTNFIKKHNRIPNTVEFKDFGISRSAIRHNFGSISQLKVYMKKNHPTVLKDAISVTLFDPKKFQEIQEYAKGANRFIITTAVTDTPVHKLFLKSLKSYCKVNKAILLILPCSDKSFTEESILDPILDNEFIVGKDLSLNKNIHIRQIQLSARMVDPSTGLDRLSQRDGGFIYASPKQRLKFIANSANKLPHPIMTTGAVTLPKYNDSNYMSKRTAYIAKNDHVLGAVIVELDENNIYYFRQVQAEPKTGNFIDLGKVYSSDDTVKQVDCEAFILGDYHAGEHDLETKQVWKEVCSEITVKNLVLHDSFNGKYHNHHDTFKTITRAKLAEADRISLEDELSILNTELNDMCTWINGRLVIVKSNHDEVLARYLQEARYINDPTNLRFASQLVAPMIDGTDPLVYGLANIDKLSNKPVAKLKQQSKILFLERDESFKIAGIELGVHGDIGANGSRGGNLGIFEKAYGACIIGHSHSCEILRDVWRVGTTSQMRLDYTSGASSWTHSSCLVYRNGSRQMIHNINGKWKLNKKGK